MEQGYSPDLNLASISIANRCYKSVLGPHPRPICVRVKSVVMAQPAPFRRRFYLKKTDWDDYAAELDTFIYDVEARPDNYDGS